MRSSRIQRLCGRTLCLKKAPKKNFLLRSFHFQCQTSAWGRNVCESLSSCLRFLLIFLSSSSAPHPSILSLSAVQIRQWKQWIWCLFLSCPPPRLSLHLARPVSLTVTPCRTLSPMPETPHFYLPFVYLFCLFCRPFLLPVLRYHSRSPFYPPFYPWSFCLSSLFCLFFSLTLSVFLCDFMLQLLYYQSVWGCVNINNTATHTLMDR